jgi:hypothetical protein
MYEFRNIQNKNVEGNSPIKCPSWSFVNEHRYMDGGRQSLKIIILTLLKNYLRKFLKTKMKCTAENKANRNVPVFESKLSAEIFRFF